MCFVCIFGPFQRLMQTRGFKTAGKWLFHVYVEPKLPWSRGTLTIWLGTENQREMMLGYVIVWQYSALPVVVVSRAWILELLVFTCRSHTRKNILTVVSTRFGVYSLARCELVWRLWICIFSQSFGFSRQPNITKSAIWLRTSQDCDKAGLHNLLSDSQGSEKTPSKALQITFVLCFMTVHAMICYEDKYMAHKVKTIPAMLAQLHKCIQLSLTSQLHVYFLSKYRISHPAIWPLPYFPLVIDWGAWGEIVFVHVCKCAWVALWLSGTLMSQLIIVESLRFSLALRGSNTRSNQQHARERGWPQRFTEKLQNLYK